MAVAAYDSDLTATNSGELTDASNDVNWNDSSNAAWDDAGEPADEVNFYIQGVECVSAQFTKTGIGTIINIQGASFTVDTDGAILIWGFWASPASLATFANGGVRTLVGNSLGDFYAWDASGSNFEPNPFGGWYNYAINPDDPTGASEAQLTADYTVGSPTGTWTHVGLAVNGTEQARGYPFAVDAIRVGRCTMEVTAGEAAAYGTFTGMASFDDSSGERYAVFQSVIGGYRWQGLMSLGLTGTAVDFRDANASIIVANTPTVTSNFNKIEIHNASSNVEWTSVSINAYGVNDTTATTASPGSFEVVDNATVVLTTCTFIDMTTFSFLSNSSVLDSTFLRCGQITHGGATMNGSTITESTVAADTGSLIYNNTADPNGEMDNMSFSKGTNAHHAIEFGLASPTTITLTNLSYSGFNASDDQTDSTLYIKRTSGTVTININGGDTPSYKTDGATVDIVAGAVTTTITTTDTGGTTVSGVRVLVIAKDDTGPMPYDDIVTITRVSSTATVSHTAHGMDTNDKVQIKYANEIEYNGIQTITKIDAGSYSYTVTGTPDTPATGTIKANYAALSGLTDASGEISMSRSFASDQPIIGKARKSSGSPFYKTAGLTGTIDNGSGFSVNIQMILDQ